MFGIKLGEVEGGQSGQFLQTAIFIPIFYMGTNMKFAHFVIT